MKNLICEDYAIYIDDSINWIFARVHWKQYNNNIYLNIKPTLCDRFKCVFAKSDKEGYRKLVGDFRYIPKGEYRCTSIYKDDLHFIKLK